MKAYVYVRDNPGNPWGPFDSFPEARAFRQELIRDWPRLETDSWIIGFSHSHWSSPE